MNTLNFIKENGKQKVLPCTFIIKVIRADKKTIQGHIKWIEKEKSVAFRSYMELLHLTQEALNSGDDPETKYRSWNDR